MSSHVFFCIIARKQAFQTDPKKRLTHWIRGIMTNILQTTFSKTCCKMKCLKFLSQFHWRQTITWNNDVIKWKHFPRNWPFVREIHRSPVNFPHKGQWRGALMFSLIYAWINDWVNNREAGDLRRQHDHCDVIVMETMTKFNYACVTRPQCINPLWSELCCK